MGQCATASERELCGSDADVVLLLQGRRDCDFTITTGPTCLDGWCIGGLLCDPTTGTVRLYSLQLRIPV